MMMRNTKQVSSNVATVIPEIGFEDDPTSPVNLEETVTNKKPNAIISSAPSMLKRRFNCGTAMITRINATIPPKTNFIDRS